MAELNHAVTLQALDEDRLGEELTIVWELEVGRRPSRDLAGAGGSGGRMGESRA